MTEISALEDNSQQLVDHQNCNLTALLQKINTKTARVSVIGLGYVGLPFLLEKAKVGLNVIGIDRLSHRVAAVKAGKSYITGIDDAELQQVIASGLVDTTTDYAGLVDADVIVICVPTPLDKNLCPDLQYVVHVAQHIAKYLQRGQLVSLESTTYPGTTQEIIKPILEENGLIAGEDFFLAHSPERVDPGNQRYNTINTNKVVGGNDPQSLIAAEAFYKLAIENVVSVSSAKVAEMVKVFENTYRAVNIALANEMALLCDRMDINVWEVLDAAFTKPFGIMPFYPGPGVGGHCIPVDPHYLEWKAKEFHFQTRFIMLASEINRKMPKFVVDKIARLLNQKQKALNGANVLMLGITYKKDVPDYRESPALIIYELLQRAGVNIGYHDPFVPEIELDGHKIVSMELNSTIVGGADLVLITTAHTTIDYQKIVDQAQIVLDTRNVTKGMQTNKVVLL